MTADAVAIVIVATLAFISLYVIGLGTILWTTIASLLQWAFPQRFPPNGAPKRLLIGVLCGFSFLAIDRIGWGPYPPFHPVIEVAQTVLGFSGLCIAFINVVRWLRRKPHSAP